MLVESPRRYREHLLVFLVEPLVARAGILDHVMVRAADTAARPAASRRAQQRHVAAIVGIAGPPVTRLVYSSMIPPASPVSRGQPLQGNSHLRRRVAPLRRVDGRTKVLPLLVVLFVESSLVHPHERRIQAVQPDHRRVSVVGVVVPRRIGGEDEIWVRCRQAAVICRAEA